MDPIFLPEVGDSPAVPGRALPRQLDPEIAFTAPLTADSMRAGMYKRMNCTAGAPPACLAARRAAGSDEESCILANVAARFVSTPTMIARPRFDVWELRNAMAISGFQVAEFERANGHGWWVEQQLADAARENSNL